MENSTDNNSSPQTEGLGNDQGNYKQKTTEEFLQFFPNSFIQYFDDTKEKNARKAESSPVFVREAAEERQRNGVGVFFSPNAFNGSRKKENVDVIRSLYLDLDVAKEKEKLERETIKQRKQEKYALLKQFSYQPHAIIDTKNGLQPIWLIEPTTIDLFSQAEELLIGFFGGDTGAKDVTRVLRLPNFKHLKNPDDPYLCTLTFDFLEQKPHKIEKIIAALPAVVQTATKDKHSNSSTDCIPEGGRNTRLTSIAGTLRKKGLSTEAVTQSLLAINQQECKPPLSDSEVAAIAQSVSRYPQGKPVDTDQEEQVEPIVICIADVERKEVQWLWQNHIPLGKLTMIDGDPGLGKSYVSCAITCAVTTGSPFPSEDDE